MASNRSLAFPDLYDKLQKFLIRLYIHDFEASHLLRWDELYIEGYTTFQLYGKPVIVFLMSVSFIFQVYIFYKTKLIRGQMQRIILSIGIVDLLRLLLPAIAVAVLNINNQLHSYMEYRYCLFYFQIILEIQCFLHQVGIWMKIILSFQRYVILSYPTRARHLLKISSLLTASFVYLLIILLLSVPVILEDSFLSHPWFLYPARGESHLIQACYINFGARSTGLSYHVRLLRTVNIPLFTLGFLDILIFYNLQRKKKFMKLYDKGGLYNQTKHVNKLVFVYTILYLLEELPLMIGGLYIRTTRDDFFKEIYDDLSNFSKTLTFIMDVTKSLFSPIHTFLYASLSSRFRRASRAMSRCSLGKSRKEQKETANEYMESAASY